MGATVPTHTQPERSAPVRVSQSTGTDQTVPIWNANVSKQQYLASMPKSNVWHSKALVFGPCVHHDRKPTSSEVQPLGGLRLLGPVMARLSYEGQVGARIHVAIKSLFEENPSMVEDIIAHVGRSDCTSLQPGLKTAVRERIRKTLNDIMTPNPFVPGTEETPVDVELLEHWRDAAKDPDSEPVRWLKEGALAGITQPVIDKGIFPLYDPELDTAECSPEDLRTEAGFVNYSGVEQDEDVNCELTRSLDAGYALSFPSVESAEEHLRASIVLSKVGAIKKLRNGKMKTRMVIDSKRSGVSKATRKYERTTLPRALDVVSDTMSLLAPYRDRENLAEWVEFMVADYRDAFFILPNHPEERRFFAVQYRGRIIVFLKTTQGSRGAPLTWARFAALLGRLTQSVLGASAARISTYVDDPVIVAVGTRAERRSIFAMALAIWAALGLPLALEKAQVGSTTTWTSAIFQPTRTGLEVSIKPNIVQETLELCRRFLAHNTIAKKELRSCTGKATHIASLVHTMRPFLSELYGALGSATKHGPVKSTVWTKQVRSALTWLVALLQQEELQLKRSFELSVYLGQGRHVVMCLDASPWGLGGYLTEDGQIVSYFSTDLSDEELLLLGVSRGDSASQQVVEALAVLVALRTWAHRWSNQRALIHVQSDSISALVISQTLKTGGKGAGIIAREIALDIAHAVYVPHIAEHVPGDDNVIADALSRKYAPGYSFTLPMCLADVEEVAIAPRGVSYYRTVALPSV